MSNAAYRWVMKAVGQPMERQAFDVGPPGPGEVVVKIAGCGVCHTDLGFFYDGVRTNHALPLTLGHEISGYVVAAGEGVTALLNRAVLIAAGIHCGECDPCKRGKGTLCTNERMPGNDIHGGFASHITVPACGVVPVDEARLKQINLSLSSLSVVADAVTTPYQAVQQSGLGPGDLAIVNGVGGVGGYCVQVAHAMGATVVAIDVDPIKLSMISGYGADLTINAREVEGRDVKKKIATFAKERGLRPTEWIVFECSGTRVGQESAFALLVRGSTLCVVGFTMDKVEVRLSNLMALHARALGNWGCLFKNYPPALELVLEGKVKVLPFVEERPLDQINEVFEAVHDRRISRRVVLVP